MTSRGGCRGIRSRAKHWALLCAMGMAVWPSLATAGSRPLSYWGPGFGYGYGYSYGYGYDPWMMQPMPVVLPSGPPLLVVNDQYYDLGVPGLRRLCDAHPELCASPHLMDSLHHLEGRRIAGITLAWSGLAAAVLGPVISTAVNCSNSDVYCRPDNGVVLGTVLGGLATTITGLVLLPGNHDVMRLVNAINQGHPEHPVGLKMSRLGGNTSAAITYARNF